MMGFYITKGKKINRDDPGVFVDGKMSSLIDILSKIILSIGKPWSETPFLPSNTVASPELYLEPLDEDEHYTIVPTTYDAKKIGPFFLTVSSVHDFSFKKTR